MNHVIDDVNLSLGIQYLEETMPISKRSRASRNKNRRKNKKKDDRKKDGPKKDDRKKKESTNCSVCMDPFCTSCPNCQASQSGFPCACLTEEMCNKCLITLICRAPAEAYCQTCVPPCGKLGIRCPVCRVTVVVGRSVVRWAFRTLEQAGHNLVV